ncbi:MAG: hypothetical protein RL325_1367 [Planctomycetota bacterium]
MSRILFGHILADLLRILVLTTGVLVTVIAFGAAIRPIMQNLLGADDVLPFVATASVPMMQFALPFAAAFAGTIVYARLAADNEVLAMSAAGLSYRRILLPALGLGLILLLGMALLVDAAVPRFWTAMQRLVTRDVTRLFVAAANRGEALVVDRTQLYADGVEVVPVEPNSSGLQTRLLLSGVAAIETGARGLPTNEFTAETATADVYQVDGKSYIKLAFANATAYAADGALVYVPVAEPEAIDLGRGIRLKPKDLDIRGLAAVWNNIESYHGVVDSRMEVVGALAVVDAWDAVGARLAGEGALRLVDRSGRRTFEIRNARLEGDRLLPREGDAIELAELQRGSSGRRAKAAEATLRASRDGVDGRPSFELLARAADAVDGRGEQAGQWPQRLAGLVPSAYSEPDRSAASIAELAAEAQREQGSASARGTAAAAAAADAARAAERMDDAVRSVRADIVARITQRINQALCAPLMLILGATLAIRLRGANPLQVYLLAFIPSIGDVLLISGGEQMLKEATTLAGIFVTTSGNLLLAGMIFVAYRQVARN